MATTLVDEQVRAALAAVESEVADLPEKVEMLMEMAMGIQQKPKTPRQLLDAIGLYERALEICPPEQGLLRARVRARMGTALQSVPAEGPNYLQAARDAFEAAHAALEDEGRLEELAEVQMNLGLVIQNLAGMNLARMTDAIALYQRALHVFDKGAYPKEFAILHNNLATAFLSIPFSDQRGKMREALAVQSFEEGLKVVSLIDHPTEYAMLQNNLGNALQYSSSSHAVENNLRALEAYDEALKVRKPETTPLEYANTVANKANCLRNLPDDPEHPEFGNRAKLLEAKRHYEAAAALFGAHGETAKAQIVAEAIAEIEAELATVPRNGGNGAAAAARP